VVSKPLPGHQRLVDGLVLPATVASHPALDFCNTLAGWGSAEPREYLASYDHLVVWAREAGLVSSPAAAELREAAERDSEGAARALARARSLRATLYDACTDPADTAAWDEVAREARAAAVHAVLSPGAPPGRRWSVSEGSGAALPVLEAARCAGDLLATLVPGQVKACPGTQCGWLFLDSRGRRRWCSMEVCGNRAKARRHARRAHESTSEQAS
jgi:predicted RNA-binding Zn ribbon-like protein